MLWALRVAHLKLLHSPTLPRNFAFSCSFRSLGLLLRQRLSSLFRLSFRAFSKPLSQGGVASLFLAIPLASSICLLIYCSYQGWLTEGQEQTYPEYEGLVGPIRIQLVELDVARSRAFNLLSRTGLQLHRPQRDTEGRHSHHRTVERALPCVTLPH